MIVIVRIKFGAIFCKIHDFEYLPKKYALLIY